MNSPTNTLNCEKKEAETDDNESLEEKCWQEEYKGASRKWLIRDASAKTPKGPLCSTMKESYLYPQLGNTDEKNVGKRKAFILKKFYEEASAEVLKERELSEQPEPDDYCTEYDGNYKSECFKPDDDFYKKDVEAFQKYPLYSSAPLTFYSHQRSKDPKIYLGGLTRVTDQQNIFRKNGQFTKPISESYDFAEL